MLNMEIIAVCSHLHTKYINTVWAELIIYSNNSNMFCTDVCMEEKGWINHNRIDRRFWGRVCDVLLCHMCQMQPILYACKPQASCAPILSNWNC
jgi:hypothetical protein